MTPSNGKQNENGRIATLESVTIYLEVNVYTLREGNQSFTEKSLANISPRVSAKEFAPIV